MNLAIVGSGKIVCELLSFIHEIKDIHVCALVGRYQSKNKLEKMAKENHIEKIYYDIEEALKDAQIDFFYIALPNHLHYEYTKKVLNAYKNVICEKPFTSTLKELQDLTKLALNNNCYLFEAITNQYLPNYKQIKDNLKEIGQTKIVTCNYSQYSSRYDEFKKGNIHPVFDIQCSGGALYDINLYNIYFVVGLYGKPKKVHYYPHIENKIDTSGIVIMEYDDFVCTCIGAKDCASPIGITIQGEKGYMFLDDPALSCNHLMIHTKKQTLEYHQNNKHRMFYEFEYFNKIFKNKDMKTMKKGLEKSLIVMEILDQLNIKRL